MKRDRITTLLIFIIGTELVGAVSAILSGGEFSEFYKTLNAPPLSPPTWLFPIAWGILYALMGWSAYLIYDSEHQNRRGALVLYGVQLFLNFMWSIVFFRFRSLLGAVITIVLLLIAVLLMAGAFYRIRPKAGILNLPYLLWLVFATYLAIGNYVLNA
ncbi:MAG: tryptophan-rich sensory protein [Oscillospiraceae bacterium]|nr:tryptophan-rich sensory protein [Oscillospiraceae bacterium]